MHNQPEIEVGIIAREELRFLLNGTFYSEGKKPFSPGEYRAVVHESRISVVPEKGGNSEATSFLISPGEADSFFELKNVIIGVGFHWEQEENQQFQGKLKLIPENGKVRAVNVIGLEDYLKSVISSEMSATSS
ncbi:MAG TPA: amidase, partial [Mariniphaga anaerophila]|nr:amidase [Mariniphaga anaerophila]